MSDASPLYERVENLLRDPQPFQDWLNAREPHIGAGLPRYSDSRPLTWFLRDRTGTEVFVGSAGVYYDCEIGGITHLADLPPWAKRFVAKVDRAAPPGVVSADEARQYLRAALGAQE